MKIPKYAFCWEFNWEHILKILWWWHHYSDVTCT